MATIEIPPYIIKKEEIQEINNQIGLQLPDYSAEYYEWMKKKQNEDSQKHEDTVIIIDI